ncbi:glycosyltransferase family 2 protein [Flavobacterium sp. 3HN19-14]|uniref:glycosyltransferase family 2 protein n=1 Tax=Flavobacterium sp. 3HN19-14 TaxID=3448133 RepID=UPI003EE29A8B
MTPEFKEFTTKTGEIIYYAGSPDLAKLEQLSQGAGDIWHSSFEQGYKNAFPELVYQTAVMFWYLNDFDNLDECVSWRINPKQFAVRKPVWEATKGFDADFKNQQMQALDFGFRTIRYSGVVPLYVKNLFDDNTPEKIAISDNDRYVFFRKNFKIRHSVFMIYRKGIFMTSEWKAFFYAKNNFIQRRNNEVVPPRKINPITGNPTISYIIPTMSRQDYALQLLGDLANQDYPVSEVIVVDATPEATRDENAYSQKSCPFELKVIWQQSKGSCRARNEAIDLCKGDYVIFGDDDIRILPDFVRKHLELLQTYNAGAANGIDIRANTTNRI